MVDSVEKSLQASRRFILLYNASTFSAKGHTSNNNNTIVLSEDSTISTDGGTGGGGGTGFIYHDDGIYPDQRQQFEVVAGMHRALLEGSLKVRRAVLHWLARGESLGDI